MGGREAGQNSGKLGERECGRVELYELLNFKAVCLVKARLLAGVVLDRDLGSLVARDAALGAAAIAALESLYRGEAAAGAPYGGRAKNGCRDDAGAMGMPELADAAIAMDFLTAARNGVQNYALALTAATDQAVRATLADQLRTAIDLYGETVDLLLAKGWLPPHGPGRGDRAAATVTNLRLFPGGGPSRRRKIR